MRVIDAATLAELSRHAAPFRPGSWSGQGRLGLAVTTEGRVWLTEDAGWASTMHYFDLRSLSFGELRPTRSDFYYGPWYVASRDGERLGVVQSSSISAPFLIVDASNNLITQNPIGLQAFNNSSGFSDDGNRLLWTGSTVYDREFNRVGGIPAPGNGPQGGWVNRGGVMSPDGRRAYVYESEEVNFTPLGNARLRVIDTSVSPGTLEELPVLRQFDLPSHAGCTLSYALSNCQWPAMNITADGRTLVIAGSGLRMLVDVSEDAAAPAKTSRRLRTGVWRAAKPWKAQGR